MRADRREVLRAAVGCAGAGLFGPRTADFPVGLCRGAGDTDAFAAAGCSYVEVRVSGDLVPHLGDDEFEARRRTLLAASLPPRAANNFLPASLRCTGPEADHGSVLRYARVAFERAERVGIEVITFGSAGARSVPEGFPHADAELQLCSLLGRLGDLARPHGLQVCVEPLRVEETNFVHRLAEARRLVAAVGHEHVGLTADLYHMALAGEGDAALREAGSLVRHVHVAEVAGRRAPGVAGDDFRAVFAALQEAGYGGRVSIECRWDDLGTELPRAVATLRQQMGAAEGR